MATIDVKLAIGAGSEQILVQADAQVVFKERVTSLGKAVLQREVLDLPLDGRKLHAARRTATGRRAPYAGIAGGGRLFARRASLRSKRGSVPSRTTF